MKQRLIFILCFGFIFLLSKAQNFKGLIGGGFTASQVSGDSYSGFNRLGANVGLFTIYQLNDKASLNLGIQFVQKGSRKTSNSNYPYNYSLRLNYIEVPLEYQVFVAKKFTVGAGVSYGRLIGNAKEWADYAINPDPYNKNEANVLVSLNIPFKEKMVLSLKYDNTLFFTPIRPHKGEGRKYLNWGQYNSVIVTTLCYVL